MLRSLLTLLLFIAAAAAAQSPSAQPALPPGALPAGQDIVAYLNQSIDWHRRIGAEEQVASDTADESFLDDDKQIAVQVLRLSFDFARVAAQAGAGITQPAADTQMQVSPQQALVASLGRAQTDLKETQAELATTREKLATATAKQRRLLQATVDELEAEVNLSQARVDALGDMMQFAKTGAARTTGSLASQIDELQRSVPELDTASSRASSSSATSAPASVAPTQKHPSKEEPSGALGLITDLIGLNHKVRTLQDSIAAAQALQNAGRQLRAPLRTALVAMAQQGEQLARQADTSDPAQLEQEKRQLDEVTAGFKRLTALVLPLGKQSILLDVYIRNVTQWRAAVKSQYSTEARGLILRVVVFGIVIAIAFALAEMWRKAIFRYVHDVRRRYQFLLLRRIILWCVIGITIAFALASEIGSLATFAGLITAGVALALQNVIVSMAGYFFLIGKYGVRVGDRVQIAGVTGQVIDIGLIRLHLMELSAVEAGRQPTGRVVVFSNSIVFQPGASFFKQIPGANYVWHEVSLVLAPDTKYEIAEQRIMQAVEKVYGGYREHIEQQHREMENSLNLSVAAPAPQSRLHLTKNGLEILVRYPVEMDQSSNIDDQLTRELLSALDKPPKLKLVGSGMPNIQPVAEPAASPA
jgi:small-conductance mechanosensitive channel